MRVSLIDLAEQHAALLPELQAAFERVTRSARFVGGPEVEGFESEFAALCETPHAVGCGSGTDALLLALLAEGVGPGDQVLVPALSFYATAGAVALLGAVPVFADVDPVHLGLDPEAAAEAAARCDRLRAVVPVHLYGAPAPLEEIRAWAAQHGAAVIEDAAQALGARDAADRAIGSGESASVCFSFYPTKNLGAMGEAGCVCTADPTRAERMRRVRNHGGDAQGEHRELGWNARLDALQAALLRVKLGHFPAWRDARRANARRYDERLSSLGAGPAGSRFADLTLPVTLPAQPPAPARHAVHHYVIRVPAERRAALREALARDGIDSAVYYARPLHHEVSLRSGAGEPSLPAAERACREVLALPVHPSLREEELERVVTAIGQFFLR